MRARDVRTLYIREMRAALRERNIVINSLLVPLLLYPLLLWAMFSGLAFVEGRTEGQPSRIALRNLPAFHELLRARLARDAAIALAPGDASEEAVRRGRVDLVAEFLEPRAGSGALTHNFEARLLHDPSRPRSDLARRRFEEYLAAYREEWLAREGRRLGLTPVEWAQFRISVRDLAGRREIGALILGLLLPTFVISAVVLGAFYPAIDCTAGERERATWETTMSLAADRESIVLAKYLYVSTMAVVAGLLNLLAVTVSLSSVLAALIDEGTRLEFAIPLPRLAVAALGIVLVALFVSAGTMILASFARTFREGQSLLTPFLFAILLPLYFLMAPGTKLTDHLALVPIVNVALMTREALEGSFPWRAIGITVLASAATIALCLWIAARLLRREEWRLGTLRFRRGDA